MNILNLMRGDRPSTQADVLKRIDEDVRTMTTRGRFMGETLDFGPNFGHAAVFRSDGTVEDLGWSKNLKTTVGMDWLHRAMGGRVNVGEQLEPAVLALLNAELARIGTQGTAPWPSSEERGGHA